MYSQTCGDLLDLTEENQVSPTCDRTRSLNNAKKNGAFFVALDVAKQLSHVVKSNNPALHDKQGQSARDQGNSTTVVNDITKAMAYAKLQASETLQSSDLTLAVSTDKSPVFTSSVHWCHRSSLL